MKTPFTTEQFFDVFIHYNTSVWPLQVLLNLLALFVIFIAIRKFSFSDSVISWILALLWLWMGIVYHLIFFSSINPAAYVFGALFIIQGLLFVYAGAIKKSVSFDYKTDALHITGIVFILYALFIYPMLGIAFRHVYPASPTFGLPCPTTIFTFGILLWSVRMPKWLVIIPFIWSIIGFTAVLNFGVAEDTGLLITGVISSILLLFRKKKAPAEKTA